MSARTGERETPAAARRTHHASLATRLAWREMRAHRWRTLLMLVLVAIPCLLVASVYDQLDDSYASSQQDSSGTASGQVTALQNWDGHCVQDQPLSSDICPAGQGSRKPDIDLARALPRGLDADLFGTGTAVVHQHDTDFRLTLSSGNFADPRLARVYEPETPGLPTASEVAASALAARRFDWRVGQTLVVNGRSLTLHSVVRTLNADLLVAPDSPLAPTPTSALLFGPEPTTELAQQLNAHGWAVVSTAAAAKANAPQDGYWGPVMTLALGAMAAIVTATLAAAAFSITVRSQRRTLAILATTGATGPMLRRIVLRQGLLVGGVGATCGTLLGSALALLLQYRTNAASRLPSHPLHLSALMVVEALGIGVVSATLAAWLPARQTARQDALEAMRSADAGSRPARRPVLGAVLLGVGLLVGCLPLLRSRHDEVHVEKVVGPASAAVVLLFLAAILSVPWLLDQLGRRPVGGLATRFALRDAARNRARATASVCAIMSLVTLAGAFATASSGLGRAEVRDHLPSGPAGFGQVVVTPSDTTADPNAPTQPASLSDNQRRAAETSVHEVFGSHATTMVQRLTASYASVPDGPNSAADVSLATGDTSLLAFYLRHPASTELQQALAQGKAVVFDRRMLTSTPAGPVLSVELPASSTSIQLPAVLADDIAMAPPVVGADTVRAHRLGTGDVELVFDAGRLVTQDQLDRLSTALTSRGLDASASAELGARDDYSSVGRWAALILLGISLLVSAVVTMLTLGDARQAHESLAAIGASRRTLRQMVGVHAAVSTGLGAVTGLLVGFVPMALAIAASRGYVPLVVPWRLALAFGIGLPLAAGLVAMLLVRPANARPVRVD